MNNNPSTTEKLTFWQKLGYGLGDLYGGGSGTLISFYYLVFLTDVVALRPGLAGIVILVSKIYDSITDPLEGVLSDRTRTRLGRRRPYLLAGVLLIFLSFFALFYPVSFQSEAGRFAFVMAAYLFFSTVVSIVMLNYNALQAELSLDYNERTSLTSFRIFFSTVSSILCALLPLEIVKAFPDVRTGWSVMAAAFGLFFALPFIATVAATRERPEFQRPPSKFDWKQAFIQPFRVRTFVYILIMYVTAFVAFDATSSIVVYYVKNYLGRGSEVNYVVGGLLVAQVISLPFYQWLSRRTSKPKSYMIGASLFVVIMFFSFLITPKAPAFALYAFAALVGIGSGGVVLMVYAIFPDIPDVDELQSRERREGIYAALTTFMRKVSSAFAVFAVSQVLELAGYLPPVLQGGKLIEQPQTASFLLALRLVFVFLPVAFISFGIFFAARFPLQPGVYQRLGNLLAARRRGDPESPESQAEAERLKNLLIGSSGGFR